MEKTERNRILIVDDEKANIIALTHILSPEYTIYAAKNGPDAIETAKEYLPDLILLDILMPEMDGYEVISVLKNNPETRAIPVIFITGLVESEDEEKGMALGASDYMVKPFTPALVQLRVRNQIRMADQIKITNRRLRQQILLTTVSQSFICNTSNSNMDGLFSNTLRMAGEFLGIAQVLLFDIEKDDATLTCRNEWINPGFNLPTRIDSRLELREPILSVIRGLLGSKTELCVTSNEPALKSAMKTYRANFPDYIIAPVFVKGKICAILDFSKEDDGREWSESDINLAVLIAYIFSGVYERGVMEKQSSIIENSPLFIMYLSPGGGLSYINPAVSVLTGRAKTEIIAGGMELIFDAETVRAIREKYIPDTIQKGTGRFEVKLAHRDGKVRTLSFTSFTVENGNIGAVAQEITERPGA